MSDHAHNPWQTWRARLVDGDRERWVDVEVGELIPDTMYTALLELDGCRYEGTDTRAFDGTRSALDVLDKLMRATDWCVRELVPPGAQTAAEEVAAEREACASLVDLCEQFARTMGDASADEYMKLAAALRARAQGGPTGDLDSRHAETPWRDLPDTDGLWWMWAGEGHDPEPVRVRTERENARDPRRECLTVERLGHEDTTHLDDVCDRYGVISLRWCPLIPQEPPR